MESTQEIVCKQLEELAFEIRKDKRILDDWKDALSRRHSIFGYEPDENELLEIQELKDRINKNEFEFNTKLKNVKHYD